MLNLIIVKDEQELGQATASYFIDLVHKKPNAVVGLATGSSPLSTYKAIVADHKVNHTDWSYVTSFNLDEYIGLEPTDSQSYRYFMNKNLFSGLNIKLENTFVPKGVGDYLEYAAKYDNLIQSHGGIDLQLLGIGINGHIGFNEPPADPTSTTRVVDLVPETIQANARFFESSDQVPKQAVSMGMHSILQAQKIILIATGVHKADIVKLVVESNPTNDIPATLLYNHPDALFIIDELAASKLNIKE